MHFEKEVGLRVICCGDLNIEMDKKIEKQISIDFINLLRSLDLGCTNIQPARKKHTLKISL